MPTATVTPPLATLPPGWRSALLSPRPGVQSAADRHDARLLAAVSLAWVLISALGALLTRAVAPSPLAETIMGVLAPATAGHLAVYAASRRGHTRFGVWLQLLVVTTTTLALDLQIGAFTETSGLMVAGWFAVSLVTVAAFLSPRELSIVAALFGAVFTGAMALGGATIHNASHQVILFGATALVLVVVRRHHVRLEAIHRGTLVQRNAELEALRKELEQRVEQRTRALTETNLELERANETLLANQRALVSSEKMAAIGRLTAGIAHDLASPLAAVLAAAHDLRGLVKEYDASIEDPTVEPSDHHEVAEEMTSALELVSTGAERAAAFVRAIRAQTRDDGTRSIAPFDCMVVLRDALALVRHAARDAHCELMLDGPSHPIEMEGAASRLAQVITNLVQNAIDATGEAGGGLVRVTASGDDQHVHIAVHDQGGGIPSDVLPRIFEPLFTTKPYGKGTGLGLAITKEAVEGDFGGTIAVETSPEKGTLVRVTLPRRRGGQAHGA